jgi:hypothetical protein
MQLFGNKAIAEKINLEIYDNNIRKRLYEDTLKWDKDRLQFTPDYAQLSQKKSHLVFIHDDMMQLQPNHSMVVEGSMHGFYPLTYGYTAKKMTFVKKELGLASFPIALSIRDRDELPMHIADEYRIRGEVYAIRPDQLIKLDIHRQNGVQFERVKVNINHCFRRLRRKEWFDASGRTKYEHNLSPENMITDEMMMYVGREAYWKDQFLAEEGFFNFKPIDIIQEDRLWLKEYYQYSRVR